MSGLELLRDVYERLPLVFALDLLLFQFVADHPLSARWWWGRPGRTTPRVDLV